MHLQRATDTYLAALVIRTEDGGHWALHRMGINPPDANTPTLLDHRAQAFVCRGAWRVMCPYCAGSQFANPEAQTRFMCCDCANKPADHAWIGIEWPDDLDEIEHALLVRPAPENMNWYPHEAPEHLHAENIDHHVATLDEIPKHRRMLVRHLIDAAHDMTAAHIIAPGTIVHPDSEWFPKLHAEIAKTLGRNVSEADLRRAVMIHATGWGP